MFTIDRKLTLEQKYELITKDIKEITGETSDINIRSILEERRLNIYWGTSPTGRIHIGYIIPLLKLVDFMKADCNVTVLFADLHAELDNNKINDFNSRQKMIYYRILIYDLLIYLGASSNRLKLRNGRNFQLNDKYTADVYKLASKVKLKDIIKVGNKVIKNNKNPTLSNLLYPVLQALDEEHLHADVQFGCTDQKEIFSFAEEYLPKINYKKRIHLISPMAQSLCNKQKMSSKNSETCIYILDSKKEIHQKIRDMKCVEILLLLKSVIFPMLERKNKRFRIKKLEDYILYDNFSDIIKDLKKDKITYDEIKLGVCAKLCNLSKNIKKTFSEYKRFVYDSFNIEIN